MGCFTLGEELAPYTVTLKPAAVPPTATYLLRIVSKTWVPAQVPSAPPSHDQRTLGVQFGGLRVEPLAGSQ
jgi:hypothetical protein